MEQRPTAGLETGDSERQMQPCGGLDTNFTTPFTEKWDVVRLLGSGGFGVVHEVCTDKGIKCAAKTIRLPVQPGDQSHSTDKEIQKVLDAERNLFQLCHPNIVRFLWISHQEASAVLFMELLDGVTLDNMTGGKSLDEVKISGFASQICIALEYMHSQQPPVIHRDIKSSNIMVLRQSNQVKLIDFGLSLKLQESLGHYSASTMTPKGTLHFMAPEMLGSNDSDKVRYSPKSDIWAFGCTVYEMATGSVPHSDCNNILTLALRLKNKGAPDLPAGCSKELREFYKCCVARDPKKRKSAADLLRHRFLSSEGDWRCW